MYRRLMIVVDEDAVSRAAVAEGLDLARELGAEVLFFYVPPTYAVQVTAGDVMPLGVMGAPEHDRLVQERASRILAEVAALAKTAQVPSHGVVSHGLTAAESIAQATLQHECDLLVVGAHGRTALQRLIHGSLAASLLPLAPVPMMVCKVRRRPGSVAGEGMHPDLDQRTAGPGGAECADHSGVGQAAPSH
jgi:nucleotide-binding universal stress UspA family protein